MKSGVYRIQCLVSLKSYIGHSTDLKKRSKTHFSELRTNIHKNTHLQNAWNEYGEESFYFSVLEELPNGLTKQQLEEIETRWVLLFNTHKTEFGYNACLPGSYPLREEGENITKQKVFKIKSINITTGEIKEFDNGGQASRELGITNNRVNECIAYWKDLVNIIPNSLKSTKGYIFVKSQDYSPDIDYINHKKPRKKKPIIKRNWKKKPEDIIPIEDRNLKRVPIVAIDCVTGEEVFYSSISKAVEAGFLSMKIYKCLKNIKYKHRGFHFKYVNKLLIHRKKNLENSK